MPYQITPFYNNGYDTTGGGGDYNNNWNGDLWGAGGGDGGYTSGGFGGSTGSVNDWFGVNGIQNLTPNENFGPLVDISGFTNYTNLGGTAGQPSLGNNIQNLTTTDPSGNAATMNPQGTVTTNLDPTEVAANQAATSGPSSAGIFGGQTPIPIPGISWPVALGATALLNNGNIFGGGGSITNLPAAVGNIASDPIGSVQSTATNLGANIMGPPAPTDLGIGSGVPIPVPWPGNSGGGGNGGATTSPTNPAPTTSPPPVINQGGLGVGIIPGGQISGPPAPNPLDAAVAAQNANQTNVLATANQNAQNNQNQTNPLTPAPSYPDASSGPTVPGIGVVPGAAGVVSGGDSATANPVGTIVPQPRPTSPDTGGAPPITPGTVTPGNPGETNTVPPVVTPPGGGTAPPVTIPPISTTTMPTLAPTTVPLDRNYLREGTQSTSDLNALWGQIAGLYGNASGAYGNADYANWQGIANQYGGANSNLTGLANQQTAQANTSLRTSNLNDVQNLYGQAQGIRNAANPYLYGSAGTNGQPGQQGALDAYTGGATQNLQYAQNQLNQAGNLSPEDVRNSQQAARQAWSARGLVNSPGAVGAEILNRSNLTQQRQQQAFNNVNTALGSMQPAVQTASANQFDPFGTILGSQYGQQTNNAGSNQNLFGNTASFSSGQQGNQFVQNAFNPYNNYSNDVYNSNFNAGNAQYISNLNNNAALQGAQTQGNANLASGFLNSLFQVGQANHWWGS